MNEVRSRLVSKVADTLHTEWLDQGERDVWEPQDMAVVALRTVCDLLADEIDELDDAPHLSYDGGGAELGYRRCRNHAAALVRSLGQP